MFFGNIRVIGTVVKICHLAQYLIGSNCQYNIISTLLFFFANWTITQTRWTMCSVRTALFPIGDKKTRQGIFNKRWVVLT